MSYRSGVYKIEFVHDTLDSRSVCYRPTSGPVDGDRTRKTRGHTADRCWGGGRHQDTLDTCIYHRRLQVGHHHWTVASLIKKII